MKRTLLVLAVVVGLGSGCSQTTLNTEWKDPNYTGPAVNSVVVVCLPPGTKEKQCEDEFIGELKKNGIAAVSGHSTIAAATSRETAMEKAREMGATRLLVSRFLTKTSRVQLYPRSGRMMMWDYDMWPSYNAVENEYQLFATVLYDTAKGTPIWSADSETFVRASEQKTLRSYVKAIIKKLERQGLLGR